MIAVPPDLSPRDVTLTDRRSQSRWTVRVEPFLVGATPLTQDQVRSVTGFVGPAAEVPATEISWRDALDLCNRLSERDGLQPVYTVTPVHVPVTPGWVPHDRPAPDDVRVTWDRAADGYRLPTEAEWELACRAGTPGPRYGDLDEIAWYRGNSGGRPRPVGTRQPNPWGLHDMLGGVWEWCWDLYDEEVYGPYRVLRGGGWFDEPWSCRAGVRRRSQPTLRIDDVGVRLARNLPAP
ncbi:formylglycine-generating enzyme required for sulfatase activity [Georgenia soli]|uniref:Formylglycine-generating enzyme required for sulfatase activity n=1 Tax=Georgenia soli TaxID=638953 RepID=A0A2A9ENT9_9MICO|nr:formylglycine-generating enzyme family protein [Georgenia soli]PFG39910.1 formylglycine-generating enzyme required for sulfatase activity [Georgenia soli]